MTFSTRPTRPSVNAPAAHIASGDATLPVPQVRESHDLTLYPFDLTAPVNVVAPPYADMAVGDAVTFAFVPAFGNTYTRKLDIGPDNLGNPLAWTLPLDQLFMSEGMQTEFRYAVARADGTTSASASQFITIDVLPSTPLLPSAHVTDSPDGSIDPALYPDGLPVTVDAYAEMELGDTVLLYWQGAYLSLSTVVAATVDQAAVDVGCLRLLIAPEWLTANIGGSVNVLWQFAREGAARSSEVLELTVVAPLDLPPPIVERAQAEGGSGENKGYLDAQNATTGVFINVPDTAPVQGGDSLEMHWDGHPHGGTHVAREPHDASRPFRFKVPDTAVAANIGGAVKRFDVYYRLIRANGRAHTSTRFHLHVRPLAQGRYPPLQCLQAQGKPGLSAADVPPAGADVFITTFPFAAPGQRFSIWVTGVTPAGTATEHTVRDAVAISQAEFDARAVGGLLGLPFLKTLKINQAFNLRAKVSYDGGDTATTFTTANVTWLG